jgi:hypothetical protein
MDGSTVRSSLPTIKSRGGRDGFAKFTLYDDSVHWPGKVLVVPPHSEARSL